MTATSDRWSEQWPAPGRSAGDGPPRRMIVPGSVSRRWWAHRVSRQFADVGVHIQPARLRQMIAGAPLESSESIDVTFAFAATEIKREQRQARSRRARRRLTHLLVVGGLILAALNLLVCLGYAVISLALHDAQL